MEKQENNPIHLLAKRLNLINLEEEKDEYILTPEEEKKAIDHAIEQAKIHKHYRLSEYGLSEQEILLRISEIDWAKGIDTASVTFRANANKNQDLWHKQQREKEKEQELKLQEELRDKCTSAYMYRLMQWTSRNVFNKDFILNDENKKFITALCYFLSRDERFESELGYSLNKGLLIRGVSGLGKTHVVRCVEKNELNPVLVLSMIEISEQIKLEGEYEIKLGSNKIIYLDDVGTEEATVNHYGTKINFFKNFIEMVYLKNKTFGKLIISTNNSFSEIEEKYGFRVRSRMKDMFNIIDVTGKDMRG